MRGTLKAEEKESIEKDFYNFISSIERDIQGQTESILVPMSSPKGVPIKFHKELNLKLMLVINRSKIKKKNDLKYIKKKVWEKIIE